MDDDDLRRELDIHLELEAEERRAEGLTDDEARAAALKALGRPTHIVEEVRALSPWAPIHDLAQDARIGIRLLVRNPGFALAATLSLSLGIGAATAMFSVVEGVLLRPLPYADADHLAMVWEDVNLPAYRNARNTPAPGNFTDFRTQNHTFIDLAAIQNRSFSLTETGEPLRIEGEAVSASLFPMLGVEPAVGRLFTAEDDRYGGPSVALISHGLWTARFGSDPGVVGQRVRLNDVPYTIVGVLPRGFHFPDPDDDLWVPLALSPEQAANHGSHFLRVVGRLKPGVTVNEADADLQAIARQLSARYPLSNTGTAAAVVSLAEQTVGDVRRPLLMLMAVVSLLLLMVCANVGNLLLARASARARELAVRAAIGAGRGRIARQLMTETLVLAGVGGALGLAVAFSAIQALRWAAPASIPRVAEIGLDPAVALVNVVLALTAGILCGAAPALHAGRLDLASPLNEDGRASAGGGRRRLREALVAVETALGVVVLVGAGLLLRSFTALEHVPLGFSADRVLSFRVILSPARYPTTEARASFYTRLSDRLAALPGSRMAGGISFLPLTMSGRTSGVAIEGDIPRPAGTVRFADFRSVTHGYFASMSIPLIAGRDVAWNDTPAALPVAVISQSMARSFWPGQGAVGRRLKLGPAESPNPWLTVIGIVGDVRQLDLVSQPRPAMYLPVTQDQTTGDTIRDWVIRTGGDPAAVATAARNAVRSLDPSLPVTRMQPVERIRTAITAREAFDLALVALFGVLALALTSIGLYGVTAYSVAQRTRELGIRAALGARRGAVLRLVLAEGARVVAVGILAGLAVALALAQSIQALLFGVGARDPITFAVAAMVLAAVSLAACYLPARRATRIDLVTALRA